ncbi:MAG: helix-turn-helix domain-containing protein [Elusimicrobia bacterium]|nr:helix-turn-helix domain-containing protein [Candidatus Obscuribacterium magneticum]
MNTIFEVHEGGSVHVRLCDAGGQLVRDIPEAMTLREACRALQRSRRHLYRAIQRKWLEPVAKFSGEFFFDKQDIERLKPAAKRRWNSVPPSLRPLFPEHDLKNLHLERDANIILSRILERGTGADVRWALRHYSRAQRRSFLETQGERLLSPRAFHYWGWLWGSPHSSAKIPSWRNKGLALGGASS